MHNWTGTILYGLWLLLPVLVFVALKLGRASPSTRVRSALAAAVVAIPAYLSLICPMAGLAWPPDIFFPSSAPQAVITIPNYRIEYAQQWGADFYVTYYEVTHQDGLKAFFQIDGDANKCWTLATQEVGTRVYFLCNEKTISDGTSYVDTEQLLFYAGFAGCARHLDELTFRDFATNPLVGRSFDSDEYFCPQQPRLRLVQSGRQKGATHLKRQHTGPCISWKRLQRRRRICCGGALHLLEVR